MRNALEWARVRALAADGISQREIAEWLGINRRTVARLAAADEPPRYRRTPIGSQLDPLEPVVRRLLEEWPRLKAPRLTEILRDEYGYTGSVRLVQAHLQRLRPRAVRPAERTGYRPGQVLQARLGGDADACDCVRERVAGVRVSREPAVLGRADGVLLARLNDRVVPGGARARARVAGRSAASASTTTCARSSPAARATR